MQKVAFGMSTEGGAAATQAFPAVTVYLHSPPLRGQLLEQVLPPLSLGSLTKDPKHQFNGLLALIHKTCLKLLKVF